MAGGFGPPFAVTGQIGTRITTSHFPFDKFGLLGHWVNRQPLAIKFTLSPGFQGFGFNLHLTMFISW